MESLKKYLSAFDVLLIGGVGCGALVLCILGSAFVYIWHNPALTQPDATQTALGVGALPTFPRPHSLPRLFRLWMGQLH
jgi:hypothetical protein